MGEKNFRIKDNFEILKKGNSEATFQIIFSFLGMCLFPYWINASTYLVLIHSYITFSNSRGGVNKMGGLPKLSAE